MTICRDIEQRRVQKAFLRYHDEKNWPLLREALRKMGRSELIGNGPQHLVPEETSRGRTRVVRPLRNKTARRRR